MSAEELQEDRKTGRSRSSKRGVVHYELEDVADRTRLPLGHRFGGSTYQKLMRCCK